jgi:hypothetical protein
MVAVRLVSKGMRAVPVTEAIEEITVDVVRLSSTPAR